MASVREDMLMDKYREMLDKPMISIGDIDDLMQQVDKLLQNHRKTCESRDSWKAKYKLRNDDAKDYANVIEDLKSQLREFKDVK